MNSPLTLKYLRIEAPLQVIKSPAGFFIGALMPDSMPRGQVASRDSAEYYPTREAAQAALDTSSFTQRQHP